MARLTAPRDVAEADVALMVARASWNAALRDAWDCDGFSHARAAMDRINGLLERRLELSRRDAERVLPRLWVESWPGCAEPVWPQEPEGVAS